MENIDKILNVIDPDAESHVDIEWYLEANEDVLAEGLDPKEHYFEFGWKEGRDPAPWFSVKWYCALVFELGLGGAEEPLQHFLDKGLKGGFTPNEDAERAFESAAHSYFDEVYYCDSNPDVIEAGIDPWDHFLQFGWKEGRNPAPSFDLDYYTQAHMDPELPPRNALLHYVQVGHSLNLDTIGDLSSAVEVSESLVALVDWIKTRHGDSTKSDVEALLNSVLFDPEYYARVSGITGTKTELVEDFLTRNQAECPNPSEMFSCSFYRAVYRDFLSGGMNPLLHYIRTGHQKGFYPSPFHVFEDSGLITAQADLSTEFYRYTMIHIPEHDPVIDYLLIGQHYGARLNHNIDDNFVRMVYGPLVGDLGAPYAFFLRHETAPWMIGSPAHLEEVAERVRCCSLFDAVYYAREAGISGTDIDPAEHYIIVGAREGISCHRDFDTDYYLAAYPDIATANVIPVLHYADYGREEGRLGKSEVSECRHVGQKSYDPKRRTILVFSHEASRTGAPIVALNVARTLAKTCNIICWLGKDGDLFEEFAEVSVEMLEGWSGIDGTTRSLSQIQELYQCEVAIVNSVVCHPVLPVLRCFGLPVVSLIHEFANYVFPLGATSRMALSSDITVVPADIVGDALLREIRKSGAEAAPTNLRIRPQGYNTGSSKPSLITAEDVRDFIGAPTDQPRTRILFGAGYVQPRKGLDLFLQTARYLLDDPDHDWYFVWVGGNYHPEKDMVTSVYIEHQINNSELSRRFTFFDEQPSLEAFWKIADVFFLSSRLDPYPNVALDALARDVPVVCFQGATGIAALEPDFPWAVRSVRFADVKAAADVCTELASYIADTRMTFRSDVGAAMMGTLSFENYVNDLVDFTHEAVKQAAEIKTLEEKLGDLNSVDLERAMRQIPSVFHFRAPSRPEIFRRTLAEFLLPGRLDIGLVLSEDQGLHPVPSWTAVGSQDSRPSILPWSADFGFTPDLTVSNKGRHVVYLHVVHAEALLFMSNGQQGAMTFFADAEVVVTGSSPSVIAKLEAADIEGLLIVDRPVFNPIGYLRSLSSESDADYITFCELDLSRADPFRPTLRRLEHYMLRMLDSGAVEACLRETESVAVLCPAQLGERSAEAVASSDTPHPLYTPRFAGTYSREVLERFFEATENDLSERLANGATDAALSIAAVVFGEFIQMEPSLQCTILPRLQHR